MFGYSEGIIKDVGIINSSIKGAKYVGNVCGYNFSSGKIIDSYNTSTVSGSSCVGGVCGYSYNAISGCYNTGSVSGTGTYVGGVCGYNYRGTMINCYNTGFVSGTEQVGGVCGCGKGTIKSCYNTGTVSGSSYFVGGVCGYSESSYGKIINCYNTGTVSGTNKIGGVCGYNYDYSTISNCYSASSVSGTGTDIGGVCVCGSNSVTVNNCYYNKNLCSTSNSTGTGKSTEELCGELSVLGFDDTVWEKGSCTVSAVDDDGFIIVQYTLPHLKAMKTEPVSDTIKIYNFGTASSPKWLSCTPIYTAEELQAINELLSNNYVLMNDITLEEGENNFTAIGTADTPFSGYFDGNGHVVSGININKPDESYQGLFGYSKGVIKGVGVINSSINGAQYVGGVCGYNDGGKSTISVCYNTGSVSGSSYVGGVCGYNYVGTISGSYNTGAVSGSSYFVGGVCGYNDGGISTISVCYNTGTVSGTGRVGGVCGYGKGTIKSCHNTGSVSGTGRVGGVCGYNDGGTISVCYNTGTVSGTYNIGGVFGYGKGTIKSCYNTGSVSGTGNYVGGVCGYNYESSTITNCYYLDTTAKNAIGNNAENATVENVESKTDADFKSGEVAYLLNGSTSEGTLVWGQNLSTKTNYPTFGGEKVYRNETYSGCEGKPGDPTYSYSNTEKKPVYAEHKLSPIEGKDATCTEDGNIEHYKCDICGKLFADKNAEKELSDEDVIIAAEHKKDEGTLNKSSLTENSVTISYKCSVCGEDIDEETVSVTITNVQVTSSKVIVSFIITETKTEMTEEYALDEVTEAIVGIMKPKNIQHVIDYVNSFTADDTDDILTDAQLKAIEEVLAHDFGVAA